ncbi:MAG TPA: ABC transporter substrate-binding protein [Solirubrobacterales bacterium]|nr:ABC transporter substrate-binding protein [Solirubrobacterales bacterium]
MKLKVFLAGRVALESDGVVVDEERFPGRQGRLLFAYLVAEQGRPVPRDELTDALWGEAPPATSEKALTVLASKLRGLLAEGGIDGAKALTSVFGSYRLNLPDGTWVDIIAAADALREAEAALAADDFERAKTVAMQAASLARPSFFPGEEGVWVDGKRRELTDILRRALSCLAEASLRSGDAAGAASWAEETIALEPYRETGYRQLMAAHAAAGNRAEALRVYERCRQLLATELGAYPSPETETIYRELLEAPAPEPRPAPPEPTPVPVLERGPPGTEAPAPTAAPRHRRRRTIAIGALAGVIAAAVAIPLFVLGGNGSRVDLGKTPSNIVGVLDARSSDPKDAVELPTPPTAVAVGFGRVWAASAESNTVYAIDPETNTVQNRIPVGNAPGGIAVGGGYVWVTNSLAATVSQIDPRALIELQSIEVGNGPSGIAVGGGYVWVANSTDHTVSKIRASTGKFLKTYPAVTDPGAIAVGDRAVWVASRSGDAVVKLDPRDAQPLDTIPVGQGPAAIAVGLGFVWVANSDDGTVSKINPAAGRQVDLIEVGAGPTSLAIVGREVWAANEFAGTVSRIDPATSSATPVQLRRRPTALAARKGIIYAALRPTGTAHRGGTLRVAVPAVEPFATLDPAVVYVGDIGRLVPLTNDGLLAYRHVGGQAGNQLVPDLAIKMPEVSRDGKTYRFQLRPHILYSNGRVVKASDFRYAIERVFKLRLRVGFADSLGLSVAKSYFRTIRGADRCDRRRCDLPDGIVADDAARRVTFHLSAPDANFLYKLASTFAAAVPGGTPLREATRRPLPATGPYRIASFAPNRSVRLVRNPRFQEWFKAAQPAGLPEQIVVKVVPELKERIALVKQGKADLTSSRGLLSFPVPPALKPWVHSHPLPLTSYLAFNTNRPPFDDPRARQAVNYALDREKIVQLVGGEATARPTCQVLPPNVPGYRRYCPYTADASADERWTAADRVKAAELVAASGTARAAVTLWIPSLTGLGPYLADLLESLDYRVQLRSSFGRKPNPAAAYFGRLAAVTKPRALPQILWSPWLADYPTASNFIEPLFSCGAPDNRAHFCERSLDRKIRRALKLQQTDLAGANRLWTELDREITDNALWVPLYNGYEADLVSKRVGNYEHNPHWGALLGQLWVR